MSASVTITPDFEKVKKWIEKLISDPVMVRKVLTRATLELADSDRLYPPAGPWNREPGTRGDNRWYQRQFGPRWKRKDGTTGGRNTSQRLQKNWKTEVQSRDQFTGTVYTGVTYAPFLYDDNKRAQWASGHGWQTLSQIAEDYTPRFREMVMEAIEEQSQKPIT